VLVTAIRETLTAIALLSYLLYLDWKLTLVTLTVGPVIAVLIQSFGKRIRKASKASLESLRAVAHTVEETTAANKVIKIYGGQEQQKDRFFEVTESFRRSMMKEAVPASALTPITHMTGFVCNRIHYFYGAEVALWGKQVILPEASYLSLRPCCY